jgi:uncharacterized protein (DUF1499 family)
VLKKLLLLVFVLVVLAIAVTILLAQRRPELGPEDGSLRACPRSPNCVCSQRGGDEHRVEPLYAGADCAAAWARARELLAAHPRTRLIEERDDYRRYEITTRFLRYVDDLELLLVPSTTTIHVRSASRVGRSDFGVNRARVEALRAELAAALGG